MNNWKQLTSSKEFCETSSGLMLVRPMCEHAMVPIDCPVCHLVMRDLADTISYNKHGCCNDCAVMWYHTYKEGWEKGVRPSLEEIKERIDKRRSIPSYRVK